MVKYDKNKEADMNCIRQKSKDNEYHVILTFLDELKMFSDKKDRQRFREILHEVRKEMGCKILAYSIMLNHVHMIIKEGEEKKLSSIVISICTRFAKYYNKKNKRSGKLFKRRYKSIPINDEVYFFTLFNYIHWNVVKSGECKKPGEYKWDSARDYIEEKGDFFYPEVLQRYESSFRYHPYTLSEYINMSGNARMIYYANIIIQNSEKVIPKLSWAEFMSKPPEEKLILDVDFTRYYDDEAILIYKKELREHEINNLKNHNNQLARRKCIFRLRQIGVTLIQLRKFSGMSSTEMKKAMFPEVYS